VNQGNQSISPNQDGRTMLLVALPDKPLTLSIY